MKKVVIFLKNSKMQRFYYKNYYYTYKNKTRINQNHHPLPS